MDIRVQYTVDIRVQYTVDIRVQYTADIQTPYISSVSQRQHKYKWWVHSWLIAAQMKRSFSATNSILFLLIARPNNLHYALFPDCINIIHGSETLHSWAQLPETEAPVVGTQGATRIPP